MSESDADIGPRKAIIAGQRADIYINRPKHEANLNQYQLARDAETARPKVLKAKVNTEEPKLRKPPPLPPAVDLDPRLQQQPRRQGLRRPHHQRAIRPTQPIPSK